MVKTDTTGKKSPGKLGDSKPRAVKPAPLKANSPAAKKTAQTHDEGLYRAIFDSANDIILVLDKKGVIIDFNERLVEIGGYQKDELLGKDIRSLSRILTRKSLKLVTANFLKRMAGVSIPPYEVEVLKKNGEVINSEISARTLKKHDKVIGDLVILREITENKRIEEALRVSEENFRNSMDSSLIGIHIVDNRARTLYLNRAFLDIFGYKNTAEVKVKPPYEYYTPESYAGYLLRNQKVLRGEPIPDKLEIDVVRKDGAVRHLQLFRKEILWGGKPQLQILYNDVTDLKNAETALQIMEQNLNNSLDTSLMGIYILGTNWEPLYVNQAFLDIFGYANVAEVKAKPPQDFYTPESYADFVLRGERISRGDPNPPQLEVDIIRKDGAIRRLQLFGKNVLWDGKPRPQILYSDITERKQAEHALQQSEQNFRNLMDTSFVGIRIWDGREDTAYVNQALLDIFGYSNLDDVRATPPQELYSPASHASWHMRHAQLLRGEPMPKRVDIDIIRKDGAIRHLDVSMMEVFWNGRRQYQTLYYDITERKQAEQALRLSEGKYSALVERSSDGIIILNDRVVSFANQKMLEMTGYREDEINGKIFTALIAPEYKETLDEGYTERQTYNDGSTVAYELELLTKDGRRIPVETKANRIVLEDKFTVMVIVRDITERKQAAAALKQSEQNFRNSLDGSFMGITIADINGEIEYMNQAFLKIFGYENSAELKMKRPQEFYTQASRAAYLERRKKLSRGETMPDNISIDIIRKDGAVRHLQLFRNKVLWNGRSRVQITYNDITERVETEEALRQSEQNFRNSLENSFSGIRIIDEQWHTLYANRVFLDIFGYNNTAQADARGPKELYSPEEYQRYLERQAKRSRGEPVPEDMEIDTVRVDGTIRHIQTSRRPVFWNGKRHYQVSYNDVTEKVQAEHALKQSEQNFRNSMDTSFIGIRISDKNERQSYANQALLDIFGYKSADEISSTQPYAYYSPESYAAWELRHEKLLRGEPMPKQVDVDIIRKDGTVRHLDVSMREIFWDGKLQFQTLYNDITERVEIEAALKASEQNFRNSLDSSTQGIRIVDKGGRMLYVNQAFLNIFGYENQDEAGKKAPQEFYTPASFAAFLERGRKRLLGELPHANYEIEIIRKDGSRRHLQLFGKDVLWNGQQEFQILYNDITERVQAEEALKVSEQNFRNSLDSSAMGIRIRDEEERVLYTNQAFLEIFGFDNKDEANTANPVDYYTPESYQDFLGRKASIDGGRPGPNSIEIDIIRKDGTLRHLQVIGKRVSWGDKMQFQTFYNDITERVQAEEARKLSEQNFRNSVDSSSMGIHIVDTDFKTLYANQALMDIFGYQNLDEIKATRPYKFYTPASYRDFVQRNERISRDEPVPDKVEVDIIRKDGIIRHLQVFRREVFWDGKRRYQTLYNDITEQKKTELALRESEEKYCTIFESANDIMILLDVSGKILDVNSRLKETGGYEKDELIGKNIGELNEIINRENMTIVFDNFAKLIAGSDTVYYQVEMIKKNREPIYLEVAGVPIRKEGKVVGTLALLRDITERNKSEQQIKEQRALTDRILGSIPASVVVVGRDQRVIMVNKAFEHTFGLTQDRATGKEIGGIIRSPAFIDKIAHVLANGLSQYQVEFRNKTSSLERVMVADVIGTRQNEVMAIINDITEEREMQERLYLTDRLASLGEMAAGIAHELNNPLTGVVALSQLMLEAGVPPEIKDDLEAISSEGQRAASVVKNLLSFARSHTLSAQPVEINAVITQVLSLRAYEHRVSNIEVVTHFTASLPEIVADHFQMQQVFLNIVLNAEQAMIESKGRGILTVTTEKLDGMIRISFADNGPGIPPDIINRIFDPFFTTKEVGKGTGLGLSICYGIVTKQGGRIYAQSQPGQGAAFIVELPINNAR